MKHYIVTIVAVLGALLSPLNAQTPASKEPPFGIASDATLFNGKWYRVYLEKGTWKSARQKCRTLGGQLACVPDAPTQAFLAEFAKTLELWLGATDEKVEGQWVWIDGTEMKYTAWGPKQPLRNSRVENYLGIGGHRLWFDAPNHWECVGFICEWKDK